MTRPNVTPVDATFNVNRSAEDVSSKDVKNWMFGSALFHQFAFINPLSSSHLKRGDGVLRHTMMKAQ